MIKDKTGYRMNNEEPLEKVKRIIEKEGAKGWSLAKETLLNQETRSLQLKEAMSHITLKPDYFRPAMVSFCCTAVGGDPEVTIPTSASLILFAKAIGIHDDIIDHMKKRKKHATAFGKFGKEIALVLSDVLLFKGFALLRKNLEIGTPLPTVGRILDTINHVWFEQSESEVLELHSRKNMNVSPQECLTKIGMRASEFEAITRIGGVLGNGSEKEIEHLGFYGRLVGTASLLRDELIDMLEFDVLKHRIRNESLPLPMICAMQDTKARTGILSLLSKANLTVKDLKKISRITDKAGGMDYVAERIRKMVDDACLHLRVFKNKEELMLISSSLRITHQEWRHVLKST